MSDTSIDPLLDWISVRYSRSGMLECGERDRVRADMEPEEVPRWSVAGFTALVEAFLGAMEMSMCPEVVWMERRS